MEEAQPELRLGHPALDRVAEQLFRMLADEREPSGLGVRFPQDGVEPLHEIVEAAARSRASISARCRSSAANASAPRRSSSEARASAMVSARCSATRPRKAR